MTRELWAYLRKQAVKRNERFIRCDGVVYEVSTSYFPTGPSPLHSIEEVRPVDIVEFSGVPAGHLSNHPAGGTSAGTQG